MTLGAVPIYVAASPFWRLRSMRWFWPSVIALIVLHLALLYHEYGFVALHDLPAKGTVQGLAIIDCLASWVFMAIMCWVFSRRLPWQLSDR